MTTPLLPLVICVDSDASMLAIVTNLLASAHLEIRTTISAADVLSWLAADDVAVLITDDSQLATHARHVHPETLHLALRPLDVSSLEHAVIDALERSAELVVMSGDRGRRERRDALRTALEAEYPGISSVARRTDQPHDVPADPWSEAAALGLVGLSARLES